MSDTNNYFIIFIIAIISFILSYFGASVGLVLGNLRLPLLIYALGSTNIATGTNLTISTLGAIAGTYCHLREGRVNFRLLCAIGIPSAIGAFLSVLALARVESDWIQVVIGVVIIFSGVQMTRKKKVTKGNNKHSGHYHLLLEGMVGAVLGVLSGIVGMMLGSIRLPAMIRVLGVEPKQAVGTNMAIGLMTGSIGAITSISVVGVNLPVLATVAPATLAGCYLGARSVKKMNSAKLQQLVGWTLIGLGTFMICEKTLPIIFH